MGRFMHASEVGSRDAVVLGSLGLDTSALPLDGSVIAAGDFSALTGSCTSSPRGAKVISPGGSLR